MRRSLTRGRGLTSRSSTSLRSRDRRRMWRIRRGRRGSGRGSSIRRAGPSRQKFDGAAILALGVGGEVRLDSRVVAHGVAAERFAYVVDDAIDVLFVIREELLEGGAKVIWVGAVAGVVWIVFDAAGEDLLFEAVEAAGDALEIEGAAEGGGDGLLSGERERFELIARV